MKKRYIRGWVRRGGGGGGWGGGGGGDGCGGGGGVAITVTFIEQQKNANSLLTVTDGICQSGPCCRQSNKTNKEGPRFTLTFIIVLQRYVVPVCFATTVMAEHFEKLFLLARHRPTRERKWQVCRAPLKGRPGNGSGEASGLCSIRNGQFSLFGQFRKKYRPISVYPLLCVQ